MLPFVAFIQALPSESAGGLVFGNGTGRPLEAHSL
jgi:hypothetical protein